MDAATNQFFEFLQDAADSALEYKKLTDGDRAEIINGKLTLAMGFQSFESGDPRAALRLMIGAYLIGSRGHVSDSAKIFRDQQEHGKGGVTTGAAEHARAEIWRGAARQRIAKDAELPKPPSASKMAMELKKEERKPGSITYPEVEYLTKFIRKERKAGVKTLGKTLRLVQS